MMKRLRSPKDCCISAVKADANASFCEECGQPLARCMAFSECGGLVGDDGLCHVCVAPHLQIIPGATMNAPIGGSVALPFDLYNASTIDRPLFVTGLWSREKGDWREERLGWEQLDPNTRAPASVTAKEFDRAGLHEVEIMWSVATRWRARQENFAFSSRVLLTIAGESEHAAGPVVQISSENEMNGNVIQITDNTSRGSKDDGKVIAAIDMNIHRLDLEERRFGLRGLGEDLRVPRSVAFRFVGFGKDAAPAPDLPVTTPDGILAFGRSHARGEGGEGDVHLVVTDRKGAVDEGQSLTLSRRHFELYVENDRLMLRVSGSNGLRVNGTAYGADKILALKDGDVVEPLVKTPGALKLMVRFSREFDRVSAVTLTRTPAIEENAA
ncbi:FHA domain-containing protein [uncultured Sphingomonas sp.]|uniref:FHA domain-containing protein n=1 Tax=uncultured Sphingomonas sp. TaxID=158754 RepID=UPI0035CC4751